MNFFEQIDNLKVNENTDSIIDAAFESEMTILALLNESDSVEEFQSLMESNISEMALYGVIDNPEIAMEATKRIVIENYKEKKFNQLSNRAAIRHGEAAQDADWKKYKKHRDLMLQFRAKVIKKFRTKGEKSARKALTNSRKKASNMNSASGKGITAKIDRQIAASKANIDKVKSPK